MAWNNLRLGLRPQQIIYINHRLNIGFKSKITIFEFRARTHKFNGYLVPKPRSLSF